MSFGENELPNVPQPPKRYRNIGPRLPGGGFFRDRLQGPKLPGQGGIRARQYGPTRASLGKQFGPRRRRGAGSGRSSARFRGVGRSGSFGLHLARTFLTHARKMLHVRKSARLQGFRNHGFTGVKRPGKTGLAGR